MKEFKEKEFVVFDVETTGLSPRSGDRVIEIAALKIKNLKAVDKFHTLVDPQRELSYEAYLVNGISPQMLVGAPTAEEVLPKLITFLGQAYLVGHNVKFDLGFLNNELSLAGIDLADDLIAIDTVKMARSLLPEIGRYSLLSVAYFLGIATEQQHRAMADVELTFEVYRKLLETADRHDISDMDGLIKMFGHRNRSYRRKSRKTDHV